ncbi:MAG: SH3 domain-containing protein [Paludibacteraceae bacterium]|nr:SH3 domain-containing protein [Paludibacteraceae bacterium]
MKPNLIPSFVLALVLIGSTDSMFSANSVECPKVSEVNNKSTSVQDCKTIDSEGIKRFAYVRDSDGYANLREGLNPKSKIIGTVKTSEEVAVVMSKEELESSKMIMVKTKDGKIGYIHYTRLYIYCKDYCPIPNGISSELSIPSSQAVMDSLFDAILLNEERTYIEYYKITELLERKKLLSASEYNYVVSFLLKNYNDGISEGLGGSIFKHFRNNEEANKMILKLYRTNLDKYLLGLAEYMSIDLFTYTYEKFIKEFPMFVGNDTVRKRFLEFDHSYNEVPESF